MGSHSSPDIHCCWRQDAAGRRWRESSGSAAVLQHMSTRNTSTSRVWESCLGNQRALTRRETRRRTVAGRRVDGQQTGGGKPPRSESLRRGVVPPPVLARPVETEHVQCRAGRQARQRRQQDCGISMTNSTTAQLRQPAPARKHDRNTPPARQVTSKSWTPK